MQIEQLTHWENMETIKDLLEEAKRRTILVAILALGLAYIMSLTSSLVWINLPIAILVLAALRRLSFEIEVRWKPRTDESPSQPLQHLHRRQLTNQDPLLSGPSQVASNRWRHSFDSPIVEEAVDELTRCVVNEWVTNLWYSAITPDEDAPEELRILINGVIAEVAQRAKRVNLITLLSRDMVDLVGTHFQLYRRMKAKIGPDIIGSLSTEERDEKLKHAMMSSRELHPALISPDAEYKVLKRLTGGIVAMVLKRQDKHCRLLRTLARELLACAVLRPVLNFASPGFINEFIETLAIAANEKTRKATEEAEAARQRIPDRVLQRKPSMSGLEMIALGIPESRLSTSGKSPAQKSDGKFDIGASIKPELSVDTTLVREGKGSKQIAFDDQENWGPIPRGDWAQVLDAVTQRRAQALTPEHLDNLWTKGRNYKKRESEKAATNVFTPLIEKDLVGKSNSIAPMEARVSNQATINKDVFTIAEHAKVSLPFPTTASLSQAIIVSPQKEYKSATEQYGSLLFGDSEEVDKILPGIGFSPLPEFCESSQSQYLSSCRSSRKSPELGKSRSIEDFLDLSRNRRVSTETSEQSSDTSGSFKLKRQLSHRKSRSMGGEVDWQELGRGEPLGGLPTLLNTGDEPQVDAMAESEMKIEKPKSKEVLRPSMQADTAVLTADLTPHFSLSKLQCKVLGAHFEKTGSKAFAVYTIKVKDSDNRSWQVQRRYRNFEQLHRRLKDMPYYSLSLPPKRFLSSSLDNDFVRERCTLLDKYLRDLLAIPSVAELHEVWDFLSVNSEHYAFGHSPSMMTTLAVNVDDAMDDMFRQIRGVSGDISGALKVATSGIRQRFPLGSADLSQTALISKDQAATAWTTTSSTPNLSGAAPILVLTDSEFSEKPLGNSTSEDEFGGVYGGHIEDSPQGFGSVEWHSDSDLAVESRESDPLRSATQAFAAGQLDVTASRYFGGRLERALSDGHSPVESFVSDLVEDELVIPQEWSPPKVSVPLLNLVDLVFQLQGRGWIRRQVLWMAKQILQLGIGDAVDDWLIGKIQWLRKEEVVASGIQWVKRMLWPNGIFVGKQRRKLSPASSAQDSGILVSDDHEQWPQRPPINSFEYRREAARRAGVVREIICDKAPAPLVSLIGKNQYSRCAKDIYYFSQSTVCVKQLAYSLLEMLVLATFPELHDLVLDVRSSVT